MYNRSGNTTFTETAGPSSDEAADGDEDNDEDCS